MRPIASMIFACALGCSPAVVPEPSSGGRAQTAPESSTSERCLCDPDQPDCARDGCVVWTCETVPDDLRRKVRCRADRPDGVGGGRGAYGCPDGSAAGRLECPGEDAPGRGGWSCQGDDTGWTCERDDGPRGNPDGGGSLPPPPAPPPNRPPECVCVPTQQRWCHAGFLECKWGKQVCEPDGRWGACVPTEEAPGFCAVTGGRYFAPCCVAAGECCQDFPSDASVGNCAGIVCE